MSDRDELADVIETAHLHGATDQDIADAILSAGYRKPDTAGTPDDLDALPIGAVIKGEYQVYEKNTAGNWITPGEDAENWRSSEVVFLNEGGPVFKVIYTTEGAPF